MKKKFLSLALVLAMALTLLPTAALAEGCQHTGDTADSTATTMTKITAASTGDYNCALGYVTAAPDASANLYQCSVCHKYFDATMDGTTTTQINSVTDASTGVVQPQASHNYVKASATGKCENKTGSDANAKQCTVDCTHATKTWSVDAKDSTKCVQTCSTCGSVTTAAQAHVYNDSSDANPSGKCSNCKADCPHTTYENGKCKDCGKAEPPEPEPETKAISAVQAVCNPAPATAGGSVTFVLGATVEGASNATAAAALEVTSVLWKLNGSTTVDSTGTKDKAPATPGVYSVAVTVALKAGASGFTLAEGAKVVQIDNLTVQGTSSTTPEDTTPPTTNSQGIPVASEIKNEKQADAAVEILKNSNSDELQERLSTSTAAVESLESLDRTVSRIKNIDVRVEKEDGLPSVLTNASVGVVGAALNANASVVRFSLAPSSRNLGLSSGYQVDLSVTGVVSSSALVVPMVITLPVPADVEPGRLVVLHYAGGSSYPTLVPSTVSGGYVRFVATGFSTYAFADRGDVPDSYYRPGGVYTTVKSGARNDGSLDDATLASIAAMLSGDGVFVDVPGSHWAAKEIRWARDGGLMSGYENGAFGPTASTTRQQLWMVLARLSGTRPGSMAEARQWAINTGVSDGSNPTGALSRQQLVTMLYRFAKTQGKDVSASAKLTGFADSGKVASYAKEALSWASAKGIMSGSNGKLNPEGTATRAHFAVFLYRYSNG